MREVAGTTSANSISSQPPDIPMRKGIIETVASSAGKGKRTRKGEADILRENETSAAAIAAANGNLPRSVPLLGETEQRSTAAIDDNDLTIYAHD